MRLAQSSSCARAPQPRTVEIIGTGGLVCVVFVCLVCFAALAVGGLALSACSTTPGSDSPFGPFPGMSGPSNPAETPARYTAEEIVGRWGVASYQKDADRVRTEAAARRQCGKAYTIAKGPNGGVMMHLPDQRTRRRSFGSRGRRRQDLRGAGGRGRRRAGSRNRLLRRARAGHALCRSGDRGPFRHHGLRALRAEGVITNRPKTSARPRASGDPEPGFRIFVVWIPASAGMSGV